MAAISSFVAEKRLERSEFKMRRLGVPLRSYIHHPFHRMSLGGLRVRRVLDPIASERGLPEAIVLDNGPEFRGRALAAWSEGQGHRFALRVASHLRRRDKPRETPAQFRLL